MQKPLMVLKIFYFSAEFNLFSCSWGFEVKYDLDMF